MSSWAQECAITTSSLATAADCVLGLPKPWQKLSHDSLCESKRRQRNFECGKQGKRQACSSAKERATSAFETRSEKLAKASYRMAGHNCLLVLQLRPSFSLRRVLSALFL